MNELSESLGIVSSRTDVQAGLIVLASLLLAWLAG